MDLKYKKIHFILLNCMAYAPSGAVQQDRLVAERYGIGSRILLYLSTISRYLHGYVDITTRWLNYIFRARIF